MKLKTETKRTNGRRIRRASTPKYMYDDDADPPDTGKRSFWSKMKNFFGGGAKPAPIRVKKGEPVLGAKPQATPIKDGHSESVTAHNVLAILAQIDEWAASKRARLRRKLRKCEAMLRFWTWKTALAEETENTKEKTVTEAEDTVPANEKHTLERRRGAMVAIPVAAVVADATIMQPAWTLWRGTFTTSAIETDLTSSLRALLIAFTLVFTVRLIGAKLRHAIVELFGEKAAHAFSLVVIAVGALGCYLLATATATLQSVLFSILGGGTSTTVGESTFKFVVSFLIAASFVSGYFASAPRAENAHRLRRPLRKAARSHTRFRYMKVMAEAAVDKAHENLNAFERKVLAKKLGQGHVALAEVGIVKASEPELYGIEANDEPTMLLAAAMNALEDELEQLAKPIETVAVIEPMKAESHTGVGEQDDAETKGDTDGDSNGSAPAETGAATDAETTARSQRSRKSSTAKPKPLSARNNGEKAAARETLVATTNGNAGDA